MKLKRILAVAFAAVMTASVYAATVYAADVKENQQQTTEAAADTGRQEKHGRKEKTEEPENAIGKDAAKDAALKDAGVTADETGKVRCRVSETEDGSVIYKVRFSANDKFYAYEIDAVSGKVIGSTVQTAEEHAAAKEQARAAKGTDADAVANGQAGGRKRGRHGKTAAADAAESGTAAGSSVS